MAQDRTPADELSDALRKLARRWQRNFDEAAPELAQYFSRAVAERSSATLKAILKTAGFTVKFKMTPAMRDIMAATVGQQVSLIKWVPSRYFTNIEGMVMRSVQTGRDLEQLIKDLQEHFGVTRRRAAFVARDQNNKATASMTRAPGRTENHASDLGSLRRRQASPAHTRRHERHEIRREQGHVGPRREALGFSRRGNQLPVHQPTRNSGLFMKNEIPAAIASCSRPWWTSDSSDSISSQQSLSLRL
jgi:hypothetical protein